MRMLGGVEIEIANELAVDYEKRFRVEEGASIIKRAAGAENDWLFNVTKLNAKLATVTKCFADGVSAVMQVHQDVAPSIARQVFGNVTDKWLPQDWNCRFGAIFRQRPEACAVTGRQNHCTHAEYSKRSRADRDRYFNAILTKGRLERLGSFGGVANHQVKGPRRDLPKATVAVQRDCNADSGVSTGKLKTAFE